MPYTAPTVADFKRYFFRDFAYASPSEAVGVAVIDAGVITEITVEYAGAQYVSAPSITITGDGQDATATATVTNGKVASFTVTDGGTGYTEATVTATGGSPDPYDETKVTDADILKALGEASMNFNGRFYETQDLYSTAYLYLTAHYLVTDLQMAAQGAGSSYTGIETSRSVGDVSNSWAVSPRVLANPYLTALSKTGYGSKFLSLLMPRLVGNVRVFAGYTTP